MLSVPFCSPLFIFPTGCQTWQNQRSNCTLSYDGRREPGQSDGCVAGGGKEWQPYGKPSNAQAERWGAGGKKRVNKPGQGERQRGKDGGWGGAREALMRMVDSCQLCLEEMACPGTCQSLGSRGKQADSKGNPRTGKRVCRCPAF